MSLLDDIREIKNINNISKNDDIAWRHNEKILAILKESGEYRVPAPKTYITADYIPPSAINSQLNLVGKIQFNEQNINE